jgi:hypothetical protein
MNGRVDLLELEGRVCIEVLLGRYWIFDTEIGFDLAIFGMSASRDWSWKVAVISEGW